MLTPFTGGHRSDQAKDAFNFFLSQLRIHIEMSFGLLKTSGGSCRRPCRPLLSYQVRFWCPVGVCITFVSTRIDSKEETPTTTQFLEALNPIIARNSGGDILQRWKPTKVFQLPVHLRRKILPKYQIMTLFLNVCMSFFIPPPWTKRVVPLRFGSSFVRFICTKSSILWKHLILFCTLREVANRLRVCINIVFNRPNKLRYPYFCS